MSATAAKPVMNMILMSGSSSEAWRASSMPSISGITMSVCHMSRPSLEVADIFRGHGPAWRRANAGHVSLGQLKVMSAIESCRTAALGGHVARCENCPHTQISYNSCRNRQCPKCQGAAAKDWLAVREADLLPVPYYHVVFTLPAAIAELIAEGYSPKSEAKLWCEDLTRAVIHRNSQFVRWEQNNWRKTGFHDAKS